MIIGIYPLGASRYGHNRVSNRPNSIMEKDARQTQQQITTAHPAKQWIWFGLIYAIIVMADIWILSHEHLRSYREVSKPLILASLILFFIWQAYPLKLWKERIFLLGLIFSLLGDGFLNYEGYFLPGLLSFFAAHVCYIITFFHKNGFKKIFHPVVFTGILIWTAMVYMLINGNLDALKPYVILYMFILILMALTMLSRKDMVSRAAFYSGLFGGLLFLLSDSVLAINKFAYNTFMGSQVIMLTYALAQLLLVRSILLQNTPGDHR